jgi:hypothetical protein
MNLEQSGQALQSLPTKPPLGCTHSRMISIRVTEEEHGAGMVRCVECKSVIPDPHSQRNAKEA